MLVAFFLKGIAVGIVIAVPAGPVGILCLRRTIFFGRLAGLLSGLGASTADAVFGTIAGFGLTVISNWVLGYQHWLRLFGAIFLLYLGGSSFFRDPRTGEPPPRDAETLLRDYASTFVLAIINPVTLLAFVGIFAALGLTGRAATLGDAAVLVFGVWIGSFLWWIGLSLGLGSWRSALDNRRLSWINRGSGCILVFSGLVLIATLALKR